MNVYAMKEGRTIILAVVLLLPPVTCPGDAVFRCESESSLFWLPKEDTTRNQWLSCFTAYCYLLPYYEAPPRI